MSSTQYAPYVQQCYPIAVKSVRDAISIDQAHDFKDAYRRYLACILSMIHALKDEAWDRNELGEMGHVEAIKLLRLSDQCLSRASDILKEASQKHVLTCQDKVNAARRYSQPPSPVSANTAVHRPMAIRSASFDVNPTSPRSASENHPCDYRSTINALPTPPGYSQTQVSPQTSPQTYSSRYAAHTKAINQAYQRRKTLRNDSSIMQKYATANHNLSQLRKEAEMTAISKAKVKAENNKILEKQKKMQMEAERRWNERRSHLQRDKAYRQNLLACILIFEEDQPWTKILRQTLKENKEKNEIVVSVVKAVFLSQKHPLHRVMVEIQQNLYDKLIPLVREFANSTNLELPDNVYLDPVDEFTTSGEERYVSGPAKPRSQTTSNPHPEIPNSSNKNTDIGNSNYDAKSPSENGKENPDKPDTDSYVGLKAKPGTSRSFSLEAAFNDMEDEMFSSDTEDDVIEPPPDGDDTKSATPLNHQDDLSPQDIPNEIPSNENDPNVTSTDKSVVTPDESDDVITVEKDDYKCTFCNENENYEITDQLDENSDLITENEYKVLTLTPAMKKAFLKEAEDDTEFSSDYEDLNVQPISPNSDYEQLCQPNNAEPAQANPKNIPRIVEPIYEEVDQIFQNEKPEVLPASPATSTRRLSAHSIGSDMASLVDTEFLKELDNIVQELLHGIDRLHSVLLLTYEDMDTAIGKDQSYAVLESLFFKPLWPWLIAMFRKINWHKERLLEQNLYKYAQVTPQELKIREKFCLNDTGNKQTTSYQTAVDEMKHLPTFTCPLEKLECIVRTSRLICIEVDAYWRAKGEDKPPLLAGDDLLPIFSYVVLKSKLSQVVAECHAMEEFIHEGYLLGEEGYCLTTLHAAISYLLTLE